MINKYTIMNCTIQFARKKITFINDSLTYAYTFFCNHVLLDPQFIFMRKMKYT